MTSKPTLHSHTHCQVAQADTQAKTWQRVCLSHRTTDRQSGRKFTKDISQIILTSLYLVLHTGSPPIFAGNDPQATIHILY